MDSLILFGDEKMLNPGRAAQSLGRMQTLSEVCGMLSATYYSMGFRRKRTESGLSVGRTQLLPDVLHGSSQEKLGLGLVVNEVLLVHKC